MTNIAQSFTPEQREYLALLNQALEAAKQMRMAMSNISEQVRERYKAAA